MIQKLIQKFDQHFPLETAAAHCDIPCGIYDPHLAQVAALTVVRMVDLINEHVKAHGERSTAESINAMARYVAVKEEHAELAKHEIRVIWGDFIKEEHTQKYPQLTPLVHKIMQFGSKSRQTVDRETALALLQAVNEFAEIFWEIKGIKAKRVKAPYKPNEDFVLPDL